MIDFEPLDKTKVGNQNNQSQLFFIFFQNNVWLGFFIFSYAIPFDISIHKTIIYFVLLLGSGSGTVSVLRRILNLGSNL